MNFLGVGQRLDVVALRLGRLADGGLRSPAQRLLLLDLDLLAPLTTSI
ncbi:MAG: hypothetical protein R2844_19835 [Caldilineales bacterium]